MLFNQPMLVCMDLQMEFIAPGRPWADPDGEEIAVLCAEILRFARQNDWSIVHSQLHQGGPLLVGEGLVQPIPGCEPRPGEVLLRRAGISAYAHPDMDGLVESSFGTESYLIGFSAPTSITHTLYDAEDRGHRLTMIEDAVGGADVGDWGAEYTRALCVDTARRMKRSVRLSDIPLFADFTPKETSPA